MRADASCCVKRANPTRPDPRSARGRAGTPEDGFTPFGYLRNPAHVARSWTDTSGGNVRSAPDYVGVEWVYPVARDVSSRAGLRLEAVVDGRTLTSRADFAALGLTSRYHTSSVLGFDWLADDVSVEARFFLLNDDTLCVRVVATNEAAERRRVDVRVAEYTAGDPPSAHVAAGDRFLAAEMAAGATQRSVTVLTRAGSPPALDAVEPVYERVVAADAAFAATCPALSGDWPAHWAEGLHHDFQTTRMLVQPAGGIFTDVWPAWMIAWPRVVLAEGTLDMLRLAYADPALAQRAVLSLFRDAPQPNVPCVFRGGEYNMVAADGSRCGTSPAWCLPFLNLELLYLRTVDRDWLAELYPLAAAYLDWWLEHRTDGDGWLVYKCTWESGEDGNPRLDPSESGDADISSHVRPVELQATFAHAAALMAFFAAELGLPTGHWRQLEHDFRERTRGLFDPATRRYRDWLTAEQRFQDTCPDRPYWGVDPCRHSAQSLTPLLIGEPPDQEEVTRHIAPPWTWWPSWTYSLVESAAAAGLHELMGELTFRTIDRVYGVTTRRDVTDIARPLPGASPEFWPEDWSTYAGSDAYGWGATTANLLIRHLFGFRESRETSGCVFELAPAFAPALLRNGARYAIRRLNYRDTVFDVAYSVDVDRLTVDLDLVGDARSVTVERLDAAGRAAQRETLAAQSTHRFPVGLGRRTRVRLA